MMNSGNSGALAPIASTEQDIDEVESSLLSPLQRQFSSITSLQKNMYHLEPLKEPDTGKYPSRPTSGPEIDDLKPSEEGSGGGTGIDDGLIPNKPEVDTDFNNVPPQLKPGRRFNGEFPSGPEIPSEFDPRPNIPDVNVYQHKKTVAQGMMDIALLSANANQLRYVLESGGNHPYYYPSLALIGISLILQVIVGVGLILNSRYNVTYETSMRKANRINNYTVLAIFLITVMNVFISAFGIASVNTTVVSFPISARFVDSEKNVSSLP